MRIKCNPDDCHLEDESSDTNSEAAASCVDYQTLGISRMRSANISTEILGDLEPGLSNIESILGSRMGKNTSNETTEEELCLVDRKLDSKSIKSASLEFLEKNDIQLSKMKCSLEIDQIDGNLASGNVILGEYETIGGKKSLLPSYNSFTNFSTNNNKNENIKNVQSQVQKQDYSEHNTCKGNLFNGKPYALATLDGTIMLVKDEIILW